KEADVGRVWLVLEYLDGVLLRHKSDPETMGLAARWLGLFHASQEKRIGSAELHFVRRYDAEYHLNWARRTMELSADANGRFPWLPTICRAFEELAPPLLETHRAITHGDYYRQNLLWHSQQIYPIDW